MKVITLPDALDLNSVRSIQVFDYCSSREISRQQIVLNQNTFSFLVEGTKEVVFDNSTLSIDNGSFLIMKSGHCLMTERLSEVKNYRSILLFFTNEMIQKFLLKTELGIIKPTPYKSVFSFVSDDFTHRFVNSLLDISKLSAQAQTRLLEVKFDEIMLYLVAVFGTDFLHSFIENNDDSTQRFRRTIESNQLVKLSLKELAFLCNMSVSTFKREFNNHYSDSPIRWFQNKRLERAHYLISIEKKTSTEIYLELGYENLSSFIQAYKAKYGVTPKRHHKN
ncbi:helix-turn-helix domain-containing protein [Sphingobacterium yanglingense]|uniref:AraC-like DNA-binding protein n=1 Tax=Sphingobacterium yanglingense TaxID=1437280 RepID=A0A4R6W9N1_9SPHI|nr:AraC family transcriptional regulator [Sphingobacterium yanglingense]TDQ73909.1 AraC-like DNA-binding protein [Sphingobacterium yanglingense]